MGREDRTRSLTRPIGDGMLEVKNLQIKYGDFVAVDDASFTIEQGEFFTLLGPSGCGKTTMLRAMAGFLEPSRGEILLHGQDLTRIPVEKRGVGMVFQSYALFPTMTVYENIAYGLKVAKWKKADIKARVEEMARLVELKPEQLPKNVSALSGGQQQRVAIARALAQGNDVVLFDEPLSNLDAKLRKQLRQEIRRIQERTGMTAIYVTHDQEEALEMSTHIAVFNEGKIVQVGTPQEIYHGAATEFVCNFIGEANALSPAQVKAINQQKPHALKPDHRHYIREERLHINDTEGLCELSGKVTQIIFQGNFTRYQIDVLGESLYVQTTQPREVAVGQSLTIGLDPEDVLSYKEASHAKAC